MTTLYLSQRANAAAKLLATGGGLHVSDFARSLGTDESGARDMIGHLRSKGLAVKNLRRRSGLFAL